MPVSGKLPATEMTHHPSDAVDRDDGVTVQVAARAEVQGKTVTGCLVNAASCRMILLRLRLCPQSTDNCNHGILSIQCSYLQQERKKIINQPADCPSRMMGKSKAEK